MKSMKKLFAVSLMASIASLAFSFDVTFASVTGKVEFLDGSQWIKAREGDVIEQGTVVSTGYKSKATLKSKTAVFEIGPMTRITLEDLKSSDGKESTQLFLDSGSIQTEVEKGNKFKVRSAVATASVRGTKFKKTCSGRLGVGGGIVDFGPPEAFFAIIADIKDAAANAAAAAEAAAAEAAGKKDEKPVKTSPFTDSRKIGSFKGIPVFKNQKSIMDSFKEKGTRPEVGKDSDTRLSFMGKPLSESEAVSTSPVSAPITKTENTATQSASVVIELAFE